MGRLGTPAATRFVTAVEPLVQRATGFLEAEMDAGHMRRHDPRLLLLAIYSTVIGMLTEVEVLRAFGEEPTARSLVRRRNEILELLRSALVTDDCRDPEPARSATGRRVSRRPWPPGARARTAWGSGAGAGGLLRGVALVALGPGRGLLARRPAAVRLAATSARDCAGRAGGLGAGGPVRLELGAWPPSGPCRSGRGARRRGPGRGGRRQVLRARS